MDALRAALERLIYPPAEIQQMADAIYEAVLLESKLVQQGNFIHISSQDLEFLFKQYDTSHFQGLLQTLIDQADAGPIRFRPSGRMTRAGGSTLRTIERIPTNDGIKEKKRYEIAVAADMLFQTFNESHRPITVNGILCTDRLQALQRIFEHEMIHLVELLAWGSSSCKGPRFHSLARRIFGHTDYTHQLVTRAERAHEKHGIRVGNWVSFRHDGVRRTGLVNRITKRATVLVEDKAGVPHSDGKCYLKFYVPLHLLEPLERP